MKTYYSLILLFFTTTLSFSQSRDKDPVVIKGNNLSCMLGIPPDQIVAFAFNGGWTQIPVQIDEIVLKDIAAAYGPNDCLDRAAENEEWMVEYYADTNTDIGPDNDTRFDNNDELIFMAKDAGQRSSSNNCPAGVLSNSKCEVTIRDPLNNSIWGYIYLFQQTGSLNTSAGKNYVSYNYSYANNYKNTYDVCVFSGTNNNPENSVVTTSEYQSEFSQRWIEDVLKITAGNANGRDILDAHQIFINASACNRNEQVFSDGKGPIVTNKDGPVRAIRSVMGAKSGTFTQQTIKFTQYQAAYTIFYRLHTANGYNDVFDFSSDASGMTYYSDRSTQGVTINGNPDQIDTGEPTKWELITGSQGSMVTTFDWETDMTLGTQSDFNAGLKEGHVSAYYSDKGAAADFTCTGDGRSFGSCGFSLDSKQCTDRRADFDDYPDCEPKFVKYFNEFRTHYYLPPNTTTAQANNYGRFGRTPLTAQSQAMNGCNDTVEPTCEDGIQNGNETGIDCGGPTCPTCPTEPTCDDGIQNGQETGVDCGGIDCPDCPTEPTCDDGIQNGQETGIDCGGPDCAPCQTPSCDTPSDLQITNNTGSQATLNWSTVAGAVNYTVQLRPAGSPNWRSRTVNETSTVASPLQDGRSYEWRVKSNCGSQESEYTVIQTFEAGATGGGSTCTDGIQNGNETGIDCGGSDCPACPTEPTCDDGIQNGQETGIDCGEPDCLPCSTTNCEVPTNLTSTNIQSRQATLNWNAVESANNYDVQLRPLGRNNWNTRTSPTNTGIAQPLRPNTTYEWRVRANCTASSSDYASIATFTTGNSINNQNDVEGREEILFFEELEVSTNIYPSPANSTIYIEANWAIDYLEIVDLMGRTLQQQPFQNQKGRLEISVANLLSGAYFVRIQANGEIQTLKFLKE